jgi:hypothetical protein
MRWPILVLFFLSLFACNSYARNLANDATSSEDSSSGDLKDGYSELANQSAYAKTKIKY